MLSVTDITWRWLQKTLCD